MDIRPRIRGAWVFRLGAWLLVLAAAIGVSRLVPPIQSPDEHVHIMRGYLISKGEITLAISPKWGSGGQVDAALLAFVDAYLSTIARSAQTPLSEQRHAEVAKLRWGGPERFFPLAGTGYYVPLVYAPHAAGLLAGRVLGLTIADSYRLVRLACLLSCVVLLAAAWRIMRPPPLATALLLLPMTMFQLMSPTLDGVTTCLAVLVLSVFADGVLRKQGEWSNERSWLLAAGVALLATSRIQLLPLLGLPLIIAWIRRSRRDAYLGMTAVLLSAAWVAYALANTIDVRVQRAQGTGQLLLHYAAEPIAFLRVVAASLADPELANQYSHSFIGVLGWLDTWLPLPSYPALWTGLGLCAVASVLEARNCEGWTMRLLLAGAAVACGLLVFLALLVTWTPHPTATVEGVQGRYFVVPAIMLAYAIGATAPPRRMHTATLALLVAVAAVSVHALVATVLARYH
jgi:uncharacterized membrane protein